MIATTVILGLLVLVSVVLSMVPCPGMAARKR